MKNASVLFICMLITGFSAMAQRGGGGNNQDPKARAEAQAKVMKVDLNLNDAQYQKVLALNLAQAEKAAAKRTEAKEEMQDRREAMKAAREAYQAELKNILTPEQMKKQEEITKERMENRGNARGGDKPQQGKKKKS